MAFENNPFLPPGSLSFLDNAEYQNQINHQIGIGNNQNRQGALNAGLINLGAGLIGGPSLKEGLSRGLMGFNEAYNASLNANKPKVTPLADGAFSQVTLPDGTTKIIGNQQVADFLKGKWQTQADSKALLAILQGQIGAQKAGAQDDIKQGSEALPLLNSTNTMIDTYSKALEIVSAQVDPNSPDAFYTIPGLGIQIPKAQLQGMAPGLAGFFGGDQVAANKFLQGLKVDETLLRTANTKGAISNEEMRLFASPIPSLSDDREKVWKPYLQARLPVLQKLQKFYEEQVRTGNVASTGATVTGRPGAPAPVRTPTSAVPGLSPSAAKYFE